MLKFCYKCRGAVSLFLIIIMLPMLVLSSLFTDLSRRSLASAEIVEALDITTNTALTQYDNILKDVYGVFAMSQDKDSLLNNLSEYYTRSLMIAGLDSDSALLMSDNIISMFLDNTDADVDYMNLLKTTTDSFTVAKKAPISNPEILKEQMVEFMKYRAPMGVGLDIISSIKSFDTIDEQSAVIDAKKDYYEELQNVEQHLSNCWSYLNDFNTKVSTNAPDSDKQLTEAYILTGHTIDFPYRVTDVIRGYKDSFTKAEAGGIFREAYYKLIAAEPLSDELAGYEYFNTFDFNYERTEVTITDPETEEESVYPVYNIGVNGGEIMQLNFVETEHPDLYEGKFRKEISDIFDNGRKKELWEIYESEISAVKTYLIEIERKREAIDKFLNNPSQNNGLSLVTMRSDYETNLSGVNQIIWMCDANRRLNVVEGTISQNSPLVYFYDYAALIDDLWDYYVNLPVDVIDIITIAQNMRKNGEDKVEAGDFETYIIGLIYDEYENDLQDFGEKLKWFDDKVDEIHTAYQTNFNNDVANLAETAIEEVYTTSHNFYQALFLAYHTNTLESCNCGESDCKIKKGSEGGYLKDARDSIGKAIAAYDALEQKATAWNTANNNSKLADSSFANNSKNELEELKKKFNRDDMVKLQTRINYVIGQIKLMQASISSFVVFEKPVYEYPNLYSLYTVLNSRIDNDTNWKQELEKYTYLNEKLTSRFNVLSSFTWPEDAEVFKTNWQYSIEFAREPGTLYKYMSVAYKGATPVVQSEDSETEEKSADQKKGEDEQKSKEKNSKEAADKYSDAKSDGGKNYDSLSDGEKNALPSVNANLDNSTGISGVGKDSSLKTATTKSANFFKTALAAVANLTTDLRDDLYAMEYIMGMFSYKTIERDLAIKELQRARDESDTVALRSSSEIPVSQKMGFNQLVLYNYDGGNQLTDGSWSKISDYGTFAFNDTIADTITRENVSIKGLQKRLKTITEETISPAYNAMYLNEVEYIIYGSGGADSVKNTIFAIRFLSNTIAAFANSEIQNIARSVAMACFGFPPLTFLVPVAQIAITIAFAIGESFIDQKLLEAGFEVPLFKTKDSWIVSPSGAIKEGEALVINLAENAIDKAVDTAVNGVNTLLTYGDEKLSKFIEESAEEAEGYLSGCYDKYINEYIEEAVNKFVELCETTVPNYIMEKLNIDASAINQADSILTRITAAEISTEVVNKLEDWLNEIPATSELEKKVKSLVVKEVLASGETAIQTYVQPVVQEVLDMYTKTATEAKAAAANADRSIRSIPGLVRQKANELITSGVGGIAGEIQNFKSQAINTLKEEAKKGGNAFKKKLKENLPGMFEAPDEASTQLSSEKGTTIALGYSGYLRMFLLIQLIINEDDVMARTADVIQLNMAKRMTKAGTGITWRANDAYTYIEITSVEKLKPLYMSFDGLDRFLGSQEGNLDRINNIYTIKNTSVAGY